MAQSSFFSEMDEAAKRIAEEQKMRKKVKERVQKELELEKKKESNPLL